MHLPSIATTLDKETAVIATAAPDSRGGLSEKTDATGSGDGPSESTNGGVFQVSCASLLIDNMLSFPPALYQSARDQVTYYSTLRKHVIWHIMHVQY
jgi:hypothetical protein